MLPNNTFIHVAVPIAFGRSGVTEIRIDGDGNVQWKAQFFIRLLTNWWFLGCRLMLWHRHHIVDVYIKELPFSMAYPMISLSYVFGMFAAILFFHEQVPLTRWIGVLLIMGGCFLIAKNMIMKKLIFISFVSRILCGISAQAMKLATNQQKKRDDSDNHESLSIDEDNAVQFRTNKTSLDYERQTGVERKDVLQQSSQPVGSIKSALCLHTFIINGNKVMMQSSTKGISSTEIQPTVLGASHRS